MAELTRRRTIQGIALSAMPWRSNDVSGVMETDTHELTAIVSFDDEWEQRYTEIQSRYLGEVDSETVREDLHDELSEAITQHIEVDIK